MTTLDGIASLLTSVLYTGNGRTRLCAGPSATLEKLAVQRWRYPKLHQLTPRQALLRAPDAPVSHHRACAIGQRRPCLHIPREHGAAFLHRKVRSSCQAQQFWEMRRNMSTRYLPFALHAA